MKKEVTLNASIRDWNLWCRLCSKEDDKSNISVFLKDKNEDLKLSTAIANFFSVHITQDDELSNMICSQCLHRMSSILAFSGRIQKVQKMFTYLSSSANFNKHEVRLKFDINEDDFVECNFLKGVSSDSLKENLQATDIKFEKSTIFNDASKNESSSSDDEDWKNEDSSFSDKEFIAIPQSPTNKINSQELVSPPKSPRIQIESIEYPSAPKSPKINMNPEDEVSDADKKLEKLSEKCRKTNKYSCKLCYRKFSGVCYYRQHMRRTHKKELDIPQFECEQCSKTFPTELQLHNHNKKHLPLELKQEFPCLYCEKKFTTPYVTQKHISAVHLNEKPYICEECGIAVKSSSSLKVHMLTHTDDRPFECSVCNKGFKNRVGLKRHIDGHSSNKHICSECGCQLNSKASLKRHMVIHSDEKLHKCDYCGREFKRAEALKHHLILHTGLKPYSCIFCGKTFANGSNCRAHKKKSHPEELAAMEASGKAATFTKNIPKLEQLKAITKSSNNLNPVISKQSGNANTTVTKKPNISTCNQNSEWVDNDLLTLS